MENGRKNKAPVLSLSKETHKVEIEDGVKKLFDWYKASLVVKDADKNKDTTEDVLKSREVGQN